MLRAALRVSLDRMDGWWARAGARAFPRRPHLAIALFHVVHRTRDDARGDTLAANQEVTVDDFRRFLDAMLRAGYVVVDPDRLRGPSRPDAKQLLLTFDDGYYNNTWALPVLEEFHAPASFFISTSHVLEGKAFWWDAVSRRLFRAGKSRAEVDAVLRSFKALAPHAIEARVRRDFGADALATVGDVDRPFSPSELRDFSRNRWVTLGNHTSHHTILTRCSPADAEHAIRQGKEELRGMTGMAVDAIAYPNGNFSPAVVRAAQSTGHELGFTCVVKSNALPLKTHSRMTLGRQMIQGGADYATLAPQLAAPFLPGAMIRGAVRH